MLRQLLRVAWCPPEVRVEARNRTMDNSDPQRQWSPGAVVFVILSALAVAGVILVIVVALTHPSGFFH
jgi:hypothetical protein